MSRIDSKCAVFQTQADLETYKLNMNKSNFKCALVHPNAKCPERKSIYAAGFDLYACKSVSIPPSTRKLVSTGIKLQIARDCYARVAPRSGLAVLGVDVGAGVIDSDYRGIVKVLIINNKDTDFQIDQGDRIAQLILEKIYNEDFSIVNEDELEDTERGQGGFGSTGSN